MSTITIAKPPAGQQVRITGMPGGSQIGKIGVVSDAYTDLTERQIAVTIEDSSAPAHQNGCWIVDTWETVYPDLGDKVIPLPDNGNWYGIPNEYRNAVGTVVEIGDYVDGNGKRFIAAEFQSYRKPDDSERWSFYWCKPVEYTPTLHETVRMTGYLAVDGIRDVNDWIGEVIGIDGGVWTVRVENTNYPSGPGYVFPIKDGETLTVSQPALPHEEPRIITELREEAATLKRELDRANERVEEFRIRASKWERDFMRYAERIMQEANDRDWCSEYDRIMQEISGDLEIATIPDRDQEVDIEWEETYTVTVKRTGTATLKAGYDSDDIERAARDLNGDSDASRDEIIQAVRDGEYESCDFVEDSAEEA